MSKKTNPVIWPQISKKFMERKKFHNLNDEQLAFVAGCKRPNITMFLNGRSKLSTDTLLRLSTFFNLDLRDFINWEILE